MLPTAFQKVVGGPRADTSEVGFELGTSKNPRQIVDNLIHLSLVGGDDEAVWFVWLIGSSEAVVGERRPAGGTGPDRRFLGFSSDP